MTDAEHPPPRSTDRGPSALLTRGAALARDLARTVWPVLRHAPARTRHVVGAVSDGLRRWWRGRSQVLRQAVSTLVLLTVTGLLSAVLGLSTATASAPVGPHQATWEITLNSTLTLDLGPLGSAALDSPGGPVGVTVILGEIPGEASATGDVTALTSDALGQALSADGAAYTALFAHPDLTIDRGVRALAEDAARRAGLVESIILCLVAAARLSAGGRLRNALRAILSRDYASALLAAVGLATAVALLGPAMRVEPTQGTTIEALAGTPLAEARLSGRLADIVQTYGTDVAQFLEENEAFYASAQVNLRSAWAASQTVGGTVDVTVADGQVVTETLDAAAARQAALRQVGGTAPVPRPTDPVVQEPTPGLAAGTGTGTPEGPVPADTGEVPGAPASAAPSEAVPATGAWAVSRSGAITAVLTTDLHCNLDVIALSGVLDEVSGADLHMDDGDLTMTGSEPEQVCVDALDRAVPDGVARVATIGNHDSLATAERLSALGWTVTDGSVQQVGGLSVLGDADPQRTTAAGTTPRGSEDAEQLGARLATASCQASAAGSGVDVALVHRPQVFGPLVTDGCAPLLVAGHVHTERGMTVTTGGNLDVAQLVAGAGKGGTSFGKVTEDAYLHVMSFDEAGQLLAWRAVVLHPDASVTVGAWQPLPQAVPADVEAGDPAGGADEEPVDGPTAEPGPDQEGATGQG